MWVMTFHSACARMLRAEAQRLGYTRSSRSTTRPTRAGWSSQCIDELDVDPKRFTPAAVQAQISDARTSCATAEAYRQLVGSYFEQTVADVYELYEREMHRVNAMDFDDLLVRAVNVLELFPEVRERYPTAFRHVLVDEYQDTNHAQYRCCSCSRRGDGTSGPGHRNIAVVGDDDQCLVEGTPVTMADGTTKPIEDVRAGDEVLSCYGSGDFRPARVTDVSQTTERVGRSRSRPQAGRRIVSTPEHTHFAGYRLGVDPAAAPDLPDVAARQGLPGRARRAPTPTRVSKPVVGRQAARASGARGRRLGRRRRTTARPRRGSQETQLSLRYRLPTLPFVARTAQGRSGSSATRT